MEKKKNETVVGEEKRILNLEREMGNLKGELVKLTNQLQQKFGDAEFGTPKPFMGKRS